MPAAIAAAVVLIVALLALGYFDNPPTLGWLPRINFGTISFGTLCALLLLVLHEVTQAFLVALYVLVVVGTSSRLKYKYLGTTLAAADFRLLTTNLQFLQQAYRREAIMLCIAFAILTAAFGIVVALAPTVRVSAATALSIAAIMATAFGFDCLKRLRRKGPINIEWRDRDHFASFVRSLVFLKHSISRLDFREIAKTPSPVDVRRPARRAAIKSELPDIVLILHESTFDPALHGLPVEDDVRAFLSPPGSMCGTLAVDVLGGGTVQTEFSILTGLSSLAFGSAAPLAWALAPGRIHHSLPRFLALLGYNSTILSADFANASSRNFYTAMGFERLFFADDMPASAVARWRTGHQDELMYEAALHRLAQTPGGGPRFTMVTTMMNHGPHSRQRFASPRAQAARTFALAASGNRAYAEYYSRMAVAASDYHRFAAALESTGSGRPTIIVRFGDHQPKLGLARPSHSALYRTFYAIEPRRLTLNSRNVDCPDPLDCAFLPTVAMQAAGLPLDGFYTAHASLLASCGSGYNASVSDRKAAFHRSLVDAALVTSVPLAVPPSASTLVTSASLSH